MKVCRGLIKPPLVPGLLVSRPLLLRLVLVELVSDGCCCRLCCRGAHSLVIHHGAGELGLGLGEAGPGGSVQTVHLGEHEEIGDCGDNESDCSEEDDEADKVLAARCRVLEDDDGDDHPTSACAVDSQSHEAGEEELAEEDEEECHKLNRGVRTECLIGGSKPAEVGQRDTHDAVDQGQAEG